jgi:predicted PurR-regulated permease PerM
MDDTTNTAGDRAILWTPRRAALATLVVAGVTGLVLLACQFRHILVLLLLAIVLATALKPAVEWLNRHGVRWTLAVSFVFAVLFLTVLAIGIFTGPPLVQEGSDFVAALPERYEHFREWLRGRPSIGPMLSHAFPQDLPALLEPSEQGEEGAGEKGSSSISFASQLLMQGLLACVTVCILSGYWLLQEQRTIQGLIMAVPSKRRSEVKSLIDAIDHKVGAYVRGQFLLCLIVGTLSLVGYWAIGLPKAVMLAAVAGLLEAVPMIGPILGAIPALLVAAAIDPSKLLGVVVVTIVIQQLENYLLVPRIMDRAVGIHGFVTLLAIAAFGALFGVLGAILAIPLAAIVQIIVDRYVLSEDLLDPAQPEGRDRVSRLRYELQSLIQDVRLIVRHKPANQEDENDSLEEAIEALAVELDQSLEPEETPSTPAAAEAEANTNTVSPVFVGDP